MEHISNIYYYIMLPRYNKRAILSIQDYLYFSVNVVVLQPTKTHAELNSSTVPVLIETNMLRVSLIKVNDIFDNQHIFTIVNFANRTKRLIVQKKLNQTDVT